MKIGIIGLGNLGKALLTGLINAGTLPVDINVCELSELVPGIGEKYGVCATSDIDEVFACSDVIFLTVKGYVFAEQAKNVTQPVSADKTIISFMAGVPFETLYSQIAQCKLIRAMPTLAIAANDGIIGYTEAPSEVEKIFHILGYAFECAPEEIEKVMAFSACGLGFAAYLIDAFKMAGQTLGFSQKDSEEIARITFKNAIDRGDYAKTVSSVATKGGATEQGILHMDSCDTYNIISGAVKKAYERMI